MFNIVIIGTGNVAQSIADSFKGLNSINIKQVFNHRATLAAKKFAQTCRCGFVTEYHNIINDADLYIIAVKDDVLAEVAAGLAGLKLKGLVVHTSGSIEVAVLKKVSKHIGVYYPLQTFYPKAKTDWRSTPLLIEANTKKALQILKKISASVSETVKVISSSQRLRLHLAAVFACNFTNALYVSAFEIIEQSLLKKDTQLLLPIMKASFQKLEHVHPLFSQTGPAMRGDKMVMSKHLDLLKNNKELSTIYKQLSHLIYNQQINQKR